MPIVFCLTRRALGDIGNVNHPAAAGAKQQVDKVQLSVIAAYALRYNNSGCYRKGAKCFWHAVSKRIVALQYIVSCVTCPTLLSSWAPTKLRAGPPCCLQVAVKKPSNPQQNQQASNVAEPVPQQLADAPVRITRSKTRALAQGASLTSLLQARAAGSRSSRRSGSLSAPLEAAQQQVSPLPDIDGPDKHNHLAECEYVNDVYAYFRRVEPKFRAPADYMQNQVSSNFANSLTLQVQPAFSAAAKQQLSASAALWQDM
jgi:hypothetical protein